MSAFVEAAPRRRSRLPWRGHAPTAPMFPGEMQLPLLWEAQQRPRQRLARVRGLAALFGLGGLFALLSLSAPPSRPLDTLAIGAVGISALAVAMAMWARAGTLGRTRLVILAVGAAMLTALAVGLATSPRAGAQPRINIDREQWLLTLAGFLVAVFTIRHLVAQLQLARAQVERLSRTDQLTGVPNRRAWDEELPREMARSRRDAAPFTVALLDIDRFDAYNQLRGHPEGDRLMQRMAATWQDVLRDSDVMSRYDGAQFSVLMRQCTVEHAVIIIERLRMGVPEGQTVSAGVAGWNGRDSALDLMRRAEEALVAAKLSGRDRVRIAETATAMTSGDTTQWNQIVQQLLDERSVVAAYQPIVDLRASSIVAYEALARPNRERIDISVERMFSSAQRMGLGRDLDWLCRRAALAGATWVPPGVPVFINCNMSGLVDPVHRVDQMLLVLRAAARDPRDVVLEITERELIGDLSRLKTVVSTYRREGFRFAVDDVGEGHSTLEVLAATSPDFIKVARSLVVDAASAGPRAAIRAVVAFANELGASTIAEGIETHSTADYMYELGVHLGQGWYFGRPVLPPAGAPQTMLSHVVPADR
ncbi:MAG TPA: bifunctional diguanylate cyclase/phosphodiesterase [Candidatus Dormibacteraeota bacterium]|jgi:diguanylate cyclase (GGDEF)-like protein|nr:bifunctional diguanylate cyclase/phosphodiesterase [Candidatus Dormibacteraeota bacterium]